jgi:hypothetical protein
VKAMPGKERIALLVTVKAYPEPDVPADSPIAVAGVRTDAEHPEWVRLFPFPYGELEPSLRFRKYQLVAVDAQRSPEDPRPESFAPDVATLELGRFVDARGRWGDRRRFIEPLATTSMCALLREHKAAGTSLGFFKPKVVEGFSWEPVAAPAGRPEAEVHPYRFRYAYRCDETPCPGHSQLIVDWDLHDNLRAWTAKFGNEQVALEHIRMLWFDQMCAPDRDTHFFAGNVAKLPHSFLILGVFWPRAG